ncbi:Uncharacterised protein [Serratia plymuthica]|uniref:Inner membrane protein n=1 Tax=Serratia plymuthica TaxID=82996 RepID=A0A2X4YBC9_SERPL|nr:Uncharacterised protein [Serratia plymuthica]
MEEQTQKGFWYADWSFPIFVGLLSSGVFAGTHMYYLYGIGAFNEVAFVSMLRAGMDTGVYGAVAAFGASFLFARIIEGSLVGILDIGGAIQTGVGLAFRRCCWRGDHLPGRQLCCLAGDRPGDWPGDWLPDHSGAQIHHQPEQLHLRRRRDDGGR